MNIISKTSEMLEGTALGRWYFRYPLAIVAFFAYRKVRRLESNARWMERRSRGTFRVLRWAFGALSSFLLSRAAKPPETSEAPASSTTSRKRAAA